MGVPLPGTFINTFLWNFRPSALPSDPPAIGPLAHVERTTLEYLLLGKSQWTRVGKKKKTETADHRCQYQGRGGGREKRVEKP